MRNSKFMPSRPQIEMGTDKKGNKVRKTIWNGRVGCIESLIACPVRDNVDGEYFCWQGYRVKRRIMTTYTIFPVHKDGGSVRTQEIKHHYGAKAGQITEAILCTVQVRDTNTGIANTYFAYKYPNGNVYCPEIKTTFNLSKCMIAVSK